MKTKRTQVIVGTLVLRCPSCRPHSYQDKRYGDHMRVHNPKAPKINHPQEYRCTVCETIRTTGNA